jgi:hypothetical protein
VFKDQLPTLIRFSKPQTARIDEEPAKRVLVPIGNGRRGYREVYKRIVITDQEMDMMAWGTQEVTQTIRVGDFVLTVMFQEPPSELQKWRLSQLLHELYVDRTTCMAPWFRTELEKIGSYSIELSGSSFGEMLREGLADHFMYAGLAPQHDP